MDGNIFDSLPSNPVWEGNGKYWYFQEETTCLGGGQSSDQKRVIKEKHLWWTINFKKGKYLLELIGKK